MQRLRWLSLDVAAGAFAGGCAAVAFLEVNMRWAWYLVLPMSVWVVYSLDHLLDARKMGEKAHTARHFYHHKHWNAIAACTALAGVLTFGLALYYLRLNGVIFGIAMSLATLMHLLMVKLVGDRAHAWLSKESGVAAIYTLGIWGLPMINHGEPASWWDWLPIAQYFLLALVNLLEFSWYELESDIKDGQTSTVRALGDRNAQRVISALLTLVFACTLLALLHDSGWKMLAMELLLCLMALIHALLLSFPAYFRKNDRFRAWGDSAFMLPILYALAIWLLKP